jgi:protein-serine/threonine kinase
VPPTQPKPSSDNKRRTVQVEYVEPPTQTKRGSAVDPDKDEDEAAPPPVVSTRKEREGGNVARAATTAGTTARTFENFRDQREARNARDAPKEDPKMQGPEKGKARPVSYAYQQSTTASRAAASDGPTSAPPSSRSSKDRTGPPVSGTSKPTAGASGSAESSGTRPNTANSLGSNRLPSRGSYSRPAAPSVAANNAQGRMAQPKYQISAPIPQADSTSPDFAAGNRPVTQPEQQFPKGHKRANTVGGGGGDSNRFLGKIIGGSSSSDRPDVAPRPAIVGGNASSHRQSLDQGRGGKAEKPSSGGKSRRFSLLPTSFSLRTMTGEGKHERKLSRSNSRQYGQATQQQPQVQSQPQLGVPNNDAASALSGSDTSLAAGSAPASAFRGSIDVNSAAPPTNKKNSLSKHKKFGDAYEGEVSSGGHGSSGPARRVMDFFRRRGAARSKSDKSA